MHEVMLLSSILIEMRIVLGILTGGYFFLSLGALIQLIRIHKRNLTLGWTTQKIFLFLTFFMGLTRILLFVLAQFLDIEQEPFIFSILADFSSLLYFSTYTILILFWAEVIVQAQNKPNGTGNLRWVFLGVNVGVYLLQVFIWVLMLTLGRQDEESRFTIALVDNTFYGAISLLSALCFLLFGGKLFFMILHFPGHSSAKSSKLREVGLVTLICTLFFTLRSILTFISAFLSESTVSWAFLFSYYFLTEIIPSCLVFFILRKLPPKKDETAFQRLPNGSEREAEAEKGSKRLKNVAGESSAARSDYGAIQ